ncbi:MAG: ATP-dependent helicase, partial [Magnetococcales bacterium]|nr:ATP-dependent helicase [Magnetococcales bacterium]
MHLTEKQMEVMEADGHLLVTGGPGSGKTTVSILKAARIAESDLQPGQNILFLSFARATVSRVVEAIEYEQQIPPAQKRRIDVETYHSFFWRILKTHGYLIGLPRRLRILTPPDEAIALSNIRNNFPARKLTDEQKKAKKANEQEELKRLAKETGQVCFELFAPYVSDLLQGSERICRLISTMYPVILLDEFQDTNTPQWRVVQAMGRFCRLVALADPEQRIYDWIGADPARLDHFRQAFTPKEVDLSTDNHRSAGTEIAIFGNDLLLGKFHQNIYKGISIVRFVPFDAPAMTKLVRTTRESRERLIKQGKDDWSLAILVPTKKMTRLVSDALRQPPARLPAVYHSAVFDMEAAILGAEIMALLLQPAIDEQHHFSQFIDQMCNYFQGKGGDAPTKKALKEAGDIRNAYKKFLANQGKAIPQNSILVNMQVTYKQTRSFELSGDPAKDWQAIRLILGKGGCERLKEVADEVRNIRLLERGTQLRQELSQDWRDNGGYFNALSIVRQAFMREHFSSNIKPEKGVVVMNMHKAKGKQFDEVIIFEGWPQTVKGQIVANLDRVVRNNDPTKISDQDRQCLRVSVTRAKQMTTILT